MQSFTYKKVDFQDVELMHEIYRLRFQVYGEECGFISLKDYPEGLESDEYDQQSEHFVAMDDDGSIIGYMRLILSGQRVLPIKKYCPDLKVPDEGIPQLRFAEISRLVISRRLRRRKDDGSYYAPAVDDKKGVDQNGEQFIRRCKPMAFGLYRKLYQESKRLGITHWYSLMEKSLWFLLRIHGFTFECVGAQVDVYGPVYPYIGKIASIETEVAKKFPQFFEYFSSEKEVKEINKDVL